MLTLGTCTGARLRLSSRRCARSAPCRVHRVFLPTYAPLGWRLVVQAKRGDRATSVPDGEEAGAGVPPSDDPRELGYWLGQTRDMAYKDLQVALKERSANAGGRRDELALRLAELMLAEEAERGPAAGGSGRSAAAGGGSSREELLAALSGVSYNDLQRMVSERGLRGGGKKPEMVERLADAMLEAGEGVEALLGGQEEEEEPEEPASRPKGRAAPSDRDALLDGLAELPYAELKALAQERGLRAAGKKEELQERLADAMLEAGETVDDLFEEEEEEEGAEEAASSAPAAPARNALLPDLMATDKADLLAMLEEYGEKPSKTMTKEDAARRVEQLMLAEMQEELADGEAEAEEDEYEDDEAEEYEEYEDEDADTAAAAEPDDGVDPTNPTQSDWNLLFDAEKVVVRAENESETRAGLYQKLKAVRKSAAYASRAALMDQLCVALPEHRLRAAVQASAEDPAAAAALATRIRQLRREAGDARAALIEATAAAAASGAPSPSAAAPAGTGPIDYDRLSLTDLRRMRVPDMQTACRHFGINADGNKYELLERLRAHLVAGEARERGGEEGAGDAGAEAVLGMTLRTLREELDARGLVTSGSKAELQNRLIDALREEAGVAERKAEAQEAEAEAAELASSPLLNPAPPLDQPEALAAHLAALAALPEDARAEALRQALEAVAPGSLLVLGREAPVDVAVVAGCLPGRLDLAQQSLDAARALLDALYTAPLDSPADRAMRPPPPDPAELMAAAGGAQAEEEPAPAPAKKGRKRTKTQAAPEAAQPAAAGQEGGLVGEGQEEEEEVDEEMAWKLQTLLAQTPPLSAAPVEGGAERPPGGVVVGVWWLDAATGTSTLLSPAQVYAATAAELAAGCLPSVHPGLLAVPSASPLSLDHPDEDAPVPPTAPGEAPAPAFADVAALAAHLRTTAHVVFPALPPGSPAYSELAAALEGAGVPLVGSPADAAEAVTDRVETLSKLAALHYPVTPLLEVTPADVDGAEAAAAAAAEGGAKAAAAEAEEEEEEEQEDPVMVAAAAQVAAKVEAWCKTQGYDPRTQLFLVRPRRSAGSTPAEEASTALGAARVGETLAPGLLAAAAAEAEARAAGAEEGEVAAAAAAVSMVVEAAPPPGAARFVCTVVETPDGPVALLPAELELADREAAVLEHFAEVAEWEALKDGADDEEIAARKAAVKLYEPEPWRLLPDSRTPVLPATTCLRMHTPPRFSRKLTHALRHAAAAAFTALGLRDCATLEGWVALPQGYFDQLEADAPGRLPPGRGEGLPDGPHLDEAWRVPTLYDPDPYILERLAEQEAERMEADPAPLEEYYDVGRSWHADLSLFDPAVRLDGARNGEGASVVFAGVSAELPLDARHPGVIQAADVGLPHAALLRNLANSALRRAAAAGDRRSQVPGGTYESPEEAVEAAAQAAAEAAGGEVQIFVGDKYDDVYGEEEEEYDELDEQGEGYEADEAEAEEGEAEEEGEEGEDPALTGPSAQAALAAMGAAAAPLELPPQALQLPMPPQLPLYETALMQHMREADEYDAWVEANDPDFWDDAEAQGRVDMMAAYMEDALEDDTDVLRARETSDNPPVLADMTAALEVETHKAALDAAVEALGPFGEALAEAMADEDLDEAVEADAEICLERTQELPGPEELLEAGVHGTLDDPRVAAAWQLAAVAELARRAGWELLPVEDAHEEAAEEEAEREAAGLPPLTVDEAQAERDAAFEQAEADQAVLEAMCEDDNEVMELRTGLITPVQLFLRFKTRQARRDPASHPLTAAALDAAAASDDDEAEEGEEAEAEASSSKAGSASTPAAAVEKGGPDEAAADPDAAEEAEEGEEEREPDAMLELGATEPGFGPTGDGGPGDSRNSYKTYSINVAPDNFVELPVPVTAGLLAAAAVQAAADARSGRGAAAAAGEDEEEGAAPSAAALAAGRLGMDLAADAGSGLAPEEAEALGFMELGYRPEAVAYDPTSGLPLLAAVGPTLDGLQRQALLGAWGGGWAEQGIPELAPIAVLYDAAFGGAGGAGAEAAEAGASAGEQEEEDDVEWDDEDAFSRGVAAATAESAAAAAEEEEGEGEEEGLSLAAPLIAEALAEGDVAGAELAALAAPLGARRVWVVVGGDGHMGRERGLAAGATIVAKLAKFQDMVVEPFLMVPMGEGVNADARTAELLRRRTEYMAGLGMVPPEAEPELDDDAYDVRPDRAPPGPSGPPLPPGFELEALLRPPPVPTQRPDMQCIYAVSLPTLLRPSVPEALHSLERTAARESVALHSLTELQKHQRAAHTDVQAELAAAGLEGVASLWDSDVTGQPGPPPARPLDLATFAEDAARAGAIVFVAARGEMAEQGTLQSLLELNGVPFVGPPSEQLSWVWDKTEAQELLESLSDEGVDAPPRLVLDPDQLLQTAFLDDGGCERVLRQLRSALDVNPSSPLLLRPLGESGGVGLARVATPDDLRAYAIALADGEPSLAADVLSSPHPPLPMPARLPDAFCVEPWVDADRIALVVGRMRPAEADEENEAGAEEGAEEEEEGGAEVASLVRTGWVDVSFALLGPLGRMTCLPPAVRATVVSGSDLAAAAQADADATALEAAARAEASGGDADAQAEAEEGEEEEAEGVVRAQEWALAHGAPTLLCPPPPEALEPEALANACSRAVMVADRLGLRGFVQIEAFVAADTGDLVVYDINAVPDLGPDSPVWRQAAAAGLLPSDLLRQMVALGLEASASPEARAATFESQISALDRAAWDDGSGYGEGEDEAEEGELGGGEDEVDEEGGLGGLGEGEEGMLGELEQLRGAGGDAEEEVGFEDDLDVDEEASARRLAGAAQDFADDDFGEEDGFGDEGAFGAQPQRKAAGGVGGGGYMGLEEGVGRRGGRGGSAGFEDDDEDEGLGGGPRASPGWRGGGF
ncbi:hypothetical protein HYH03_012254 [Edaphochlamys debaryana]|uniref:SAP domain-containing protein n=1 Tax=Edaphochlamys debaryana TaxID=47281 RepID=A0A835XT76_9CHLO|nr:hypothetical protein HYH03_012254 [Edaphochlamys debaryana]|eukprot:KAG2489232.1 hypothetical protein HYH03_012254 [Edaphochlamys debaryana]